MYREKPQRDNRIDEQEFREMERDRRGISDVEEECSWNFCLDYTKKEEAKDEEH